MSRRNTGVYVSLLGLASAVACGVSDRNVQVVNPGGGAAGRSVGDAGSSGSDNASGAAGEGGSRTAPAAGDAGAGGEGGASCSASTCSGTCSPTGECQLVTVSFSGHVQHYEILEASYQSGVTVAAANIATTPPLESEPSGVDGTYSLTDVPRGAFLDLEMTWNQTVPNLDTLPAPLQKTVLAADSLGTDAVRTLDAQVVSFNWLAQVAVDCGIFPTLNDAIFESTGQFINPFWITRSTLLGNVRDASGAAQAGIKASDIEIVLTSTTGSQSNKDGDVTDTDAHPTKVCFLKAGPGGTTLIGGTGTATDSTGRFVMFRIRNDKKTGFGVAQVRVTGHAEQGLTFRSSGETATVQIGNGASIAPPPALTGSFKTDVYPIFSKFACVGCHSPGNPGFENSQPRGPMMLKADYSGSVDAVYAVVTATNGGDCSAPDKLERVCTNDPTNSLLAHMPFAEAPPTPEDHETTYFSSTADPYYQAIFQWIKGGAKP